MKDRQEKNERSGHPPDTCMTNDHDDPQASEGALVPSSAVGQPESPQTPTISITDRPAAVSGPLTKRLKRIAWRGTAIYVWIRLILGIFGWNNFVTTLNVSVLSSITRGLVRLAFVPISVSRLGLVLRVGWVLIITGYSPSQIIGLLIYVFLFPAWFLPYLLFRKEFSQVRTQPAESSTKQGLRPGQHRRPAVALCGSALLGWYVLFGDTTMSRPIWVAVALSGALMALLAYRAFQRAKPMSDTDVAPLNSAERYALIMTSSVNKQWETNYKTQKRNQVLIVIKLYRWIQWSLVYAAAFVRGKRGRDRIHALLVFQYALSLIFLVASAVLFWAIAIKVTSPSAFQFSKCLLVSVSHFLPGVAAPAMPSAIPIWAELGPGFTAWVLLGIYVAASGSLLPGRQAVYAQRIQKTYVVFRKCVSTMRLYLTRLNSLPQD